jgi:hypothetical protein
VESRHIDVLAARIRINAVVPELCNRTSASGRWKTCPSNLRSHGLMFHRMNLEEISENTRAHEHDNQKDGPSHDRVVAAFFDSGCLKALNAV